MKISERSENLIKILGFILAALGILVAIYFGVLQQKKARIFYQIINEVDVLDVHEPLEDLQILFQENDIQEKNLNLKIYTIKIENVGRVDILQDHFDQNDIWGIRLENVQIIKTKLMSSNSKYVKENLGPKIQEENIIKFNKIIFDRDNYFTIEILVLHNKDDIPHFYQIGKIAGIQEKNLEISTLEKKEALLVSLFNDNWTVHAVRSFLYLIFFTIVIFVILLSKIKIDDYKEEKERRKQAPSIDEPATKS